MQKAQRRPPLRGAKAQGGFSALRPETQGRHFPRFCEGTVPALWRRPYALPTLPLSVAPEGRPPQSTASAVLVAECPTLERPFPPSKLPWRGVTPGVGGLGGKGAARGAICNGERKGGSAFYSRRRRRSTRKSVTSLTTRHGGSFGPPGRVGNGGTVLRLRSFGVRTPEPPKRSSVACAKYH